MGEPIQPGGGRAEPSVSGRHAGRRPGREPERTREVAQARAYGSEGPRDVRLRWAALSLAANRRLPGDSVWELTRRRCQDFALRTWVIEHLGSGADPDWDPGALAVDTLAALSLEARRAEAMSAHWRELPVEEIGALRRHKNLTAHIGRLLPSVPPGPARDLLSVWASVREHLP